MDSHEDMCKSLLKWLQLLVPHKSKNLLEICDGVAMLDALLQISSEHFAKLESKIKREVGLSNWRLRISNLKKILEAIVDYYHVALTLQILEIGRPDVVKIGESNDLVELTKLLRLILGCAINCDRKQEYITMIMGMEETVQQNIMQAIQQLEEVTEGPGRSGLSLLILDSDTRLLKLVSDLEASNKAKEDLTHQIQKLEQQIQIMNEEKRELLLQNQVLQEKDVRNPLENARKQIDMLKEELFKAEVIRDDLKAKLLEQERQMLAYQERINELQLSANDAARLKDEIDALSESAGKVSDLELTVASYKKRLENYQDLKRNLQKLEEQNVEYLQKNLELQDELTKNNNWKVQCEVYKSKMEELQLKLDEETEKADKAIFNLEKFRAQLGTLQGEKERLLLERESLREENEELKLDPKIDSATAMSQELTPIELKQHLRFLEQENRILRKQNQDAESKQVQLDSSLSRIEKLQQQNRSLNQAVLKLETQVEEMKNRDIADIAHKECTQKISALQEALTLKENDLLNIQSKYNRSVEKARDVARNLEFKPANGNIVDSPYLPSNMKELEEKLMATAIYKLSMNCHRERMDDRLSAFSLGQGQSFLSRQRQATPRKQLPRYKSK